MKQRIRKVLGFVSILAVTLACSTQGAAVEALGASLEQTATVRAASGGGSSGTNLETAQAQATAQVVSAAATQAALDLSAADASAATAIAIAPIQAELPTYGISPSEGKPGWIHPPVQLSVEGYLQFDYINQLAGILAADFVVAGDVTWDTQTGLSGCGFVLRSNANEDSLDQYMAILSRGGNGSLLFATVQDGQITRQQNAPASRDSLLQAQNGTTNRLVVVGRGDTFTIFTNGTQIAQFTANLYDRGFIAMVALSESGVTECKFNNTWMWLLD